MDTAGQAGDWNGPQLVARLAALDGVAPEPVEFVVCRVTTSPDGHKAPIFYVADEPGALREADLPQWLGQHRLRGADRLALALLVIRETLDEAGLICECNLERRRGAIDGPLYGDPARVEFSGPARMAHFFRVSRDGTLIEVAGITDTLPARRPASEHFAGELAVLRARFGPDVRMIDAREPTLLESMVGLDSIVHVRLLDGRKIGCGIGWHGPVPFVLPAAFPRFAKPLALPAETEAAVQAVLAHDNLVRHETRLDQNGLAVVTRRRGSEQLFLLRAKGGTASVEPHNATPAQAASDDQTRWMRYAETYENLIMLDAWRDGDGADLLVVTGEPSGQTWRHHIDPDGVETWRKPDAEAAAGLLYREQIAPGTLAAADEAAGSVDGRAAPASLSEHDDGAEVPADSLLAKAEAYVDALAALRAARDAITQEAPLGVAVEYLRLLQPALETLEAVQAEAEGRKLLRQAEGRHIRPARLAAALTCLEASLPGELAAIRLVTLAPSQWRYLVDPAPFGLAVETSLPELGSGYRGSCAVPGTPSPERCGVPLHTDHRGGSGAPRRQAGCRSIRCRPTMGAVSLRCSRAAGSAPTGVILALEQVRRCARGARLGARQEYTEAEAERLFRAVAAFSWERSRLFSRTRRDQRINRAGGDV